jgi:hypothetical protein
MRVDERRPGGERRPGLVEWQLDPDLSVRTTGFPVDLLRRLRSPDALEAASRVRAERASVAALRRSLLQGELRQGGRSAEVESSEPFRRLRRSVEMGVDPGRLDVSGDDALARVLGVWSEAVAARAAATEEMRRAAGPELARHRSALRDLSHDDRIREAVFLSNPSFLDALDRYVGGEPRRRTNRVRRVERRFVLYLQRLAAKNETTSFFGPLNVGRLDPAAPLALDVRRSPTCPRRRRVFAAQWLAEGLAREIARDPSLRARRAPRRSPVWRIDEAAGTATRGGGPAVALDALELAVCRHADGRRPLPDLAAAVAHPAAAVARAVGRMERRGVLVSSVVVPPDTEDPIEALRRWLRSRAPEPARGAWLDVVDELDSLLQELESAAWPERTAAAARFEAAGARAAGVTPERGAGEMYVDRRLFFEECEGDLETFVVGGDLARHVADATRPILDLWLGAGLLRQARDERLARAAVEAASTSGRVPFLQYLTLGVPVAHEPDALDDLVTQLEDVVRLRSDGRRARLTASELPRVEAPDDATVAVASFDVMLAATSVSAVNAGDYRLVVGEGHSAPLLWAFPAAYFARDRNPSFLGRFLDAMASMPDPPVAQIFPGRRTKIFPLRLPGPVIELLPAFPTTDCIAAADLDVVVDSSSVALVNGAQRLRLYPPLARPAAAYDPLVPLSLPPVEQLVVDLGAHTPRIEVDGVVYQRERWRFAGVASEVGGSDALERFVGWQEWRDGAALPDEVFVRAAGEPKPVHVDFRSVLSVEAFDYLARKSTELVVTEMLPASDECWLEGADGVHTCELRFVAFTGVAA